jgi:hypothetical protein
MILLRSDCLVFEMNNGEHIPCSVSSVTVELMGASAAEVEQEIIEHAASAVLHYFQNDLGRTTVTLSEFTCALEKALRGLGLNVVCETPASAPERVNSADLRLLAAESGKTFELGFFPRLREQVRHELASGPHLIRFLGLRGCVKQLSGARRWTPRCQELSDQIVEYLRGCISQENPAQPCGLVVA